MHPASRKAVKALRRTTLSMHVCGCISCRVHRVDPKDLPGMDAAAAAAAAALPALSFGESAGELITAHLVLACSRCTAVQHMWYSGEAGCSGCCLSLNSAHDLLQADTCATGQTDCDILDVGVELSNRCLSAYPLVLLLNRCVCSCF
jgi:hypothetical protein